MKLKNFALGGIFAGIVVIATSGPALAYDITALCKLIDQMKDIFQLLRILAFVGAAFVLANIAWDAFIAQSDGKVIDTLKKKGMPIIIGFMLLFSVGLILSFLLNGKVVGCDIATGW